MGDLLVLVRHKNIYNDSVESFGVFQQKTKHKNALLEFNITMSLVPDPTLQYVW